MTHPRLKIVLGPPGTGKTTDMLRTVESELRAGVRPDRLAFISFTKKAAQEGRGRAREAFGFSDAELKYYRTLHSLSFGQLGLRPMDVMQKGHYRELADALGMEVTLRQSQDDALYGMLSGDRIMYLETLARAKRVPLRKVWEDADEVDISFRELENYSQQLAEYKRKRGLSDYTDMLEGFVARGSAAAPKLDALIVDEAQDLSGLQWDAVDILAANSQRVYVAGDDDQAIYRWAGADVDQFMALRGSTRVLDQSHRCPAAVHALADKILRGMSRRTPKVWKPRAEQGAVDWYTDFEEVDLSARTNPDTGKPESWLLLARNGYHLEELEDLCMRQGFSYSSVNRNPLESPALKAIMTYSRLTRGTAQRRDDVEAALKFISPRRLPQKVRDAVHRLPAGKPVDAAALVKAGFPADLPIWHQLMDCVRDEEKEWILAARKQGETLTGTPRIRISTIHTAKGGQADHVMLVTDMSQRTYTEMERSPDDEARVFYVAVTRAKQGLHLIQPRTQYCYEL